MSEQTGLVVDALPEEGLLPEGTFAAIPAASPQPAASLAPAPPHSISLAKILSRTERPAPAPRTGIVLPGWKGTLKAGAMIGLAGIAVAAGVLRYETSGEPVAAALPAGYLHGMRIVDAFALEETPDVITVAPRVSFDPLGGFLVADSREAQVRRYSLTGKLLSHFGSKGNGPKEFTHLSAALRTPDRNLLAIDMGGKAALFDAGGENLLWSRRLPVSPVHEAALLNDTLVALAGRGLGAGRSSELVHLWNLRTGEPARSFFHVPAHDPALASAYTLAGSSDIAVKGDTIAAVFALSDTLYLFDASGRPQRQIPIPFEHFRRITNHPPSGATIDAFRAWGESFSTISQVYWAPSGGFLVEYYDMKGMDPQWRLLHMDAQGRRLSETASGRLMAVDPGRKELYLADPAAPTLDRWIVARLRD